MEENLDDNSILVADGGDFVGSAAYILRLIYLLLRLAVLGGRGRAS